MTSFEQLLPCMVHPKSDELLSSWLVRLAQRHSIKTHNFCKILVPGMSVWNRDIDKLAPEALLQTLANRTITPLNQIRQTTLQRYEGSAYTNHNPFGNTHWIMPLGIYHRQHLLPGLLFCPSCLAKDGDEPYFRTSWRLAFSIICPKCGVYLHDRCPACDKPINFVRLELGHTGHFHKNYGAL